MRKEIKKFCSAVVSERPSHLRRFFDIFCVSVIALDLILLPLETMVAFKPHKLELELAAILITAWFTVEYVIRLIGHDEKWKFATSFYGLIDLIAVVPFYLSFGMVNSSFFRIFRLLKVLRILKMASYLRAVRNLKQAFLRVKEELFIITVFSFFMVYIFSASIYFFEHQAQPDKVVDMFDAIWLAFVTVTTLGYGDITPITPAGRGLTILFMFFSIGLITAPSGILTFAFLSNKKNELDGLRDPKESYEN